MIGATLSHYRIDRKIGEGGMGVVYRATDTRLGRKVAIKVLSESFAKDQEHLARLDQEARFLASLNHPNIATIYGLEEADHTRFLVLELVPGDTLAQRITQGPLPIDDTIRICRQIAEALEAAHECGIVHRDLKPANVKITPGGKVKVLDFGLAREFKPHTGGLAGLSRSPTVSFWGSHDGAILGTAAYMSPEQARGKPVDKRTDIWSFGCVVYESLTGRQAFLGDTLTDVLAAVVTGEPDWTALPSATPPSVRRLLKRCLTKDLDLRLRDAADARLDLDGSPGDDLPVGPVRPQPPSSSRRLTGAVLAALGIVLGAILAGATAPLWFPSRLPLPARVRTLTFAGSDSMPSASPDGRLIAFTSERDGRPRIWIKQLAGGGEQLLTAGDDTMPRFSPDGESVLFVRTEGGVQSVYRQSLVGGQPRKLIHDAYEAAWGPDGQSIAFLRAKGGTHRSHTLAIFDTRKRKEHALLESKQMLFGVNWSPDGSRLSTIEFPPSGNLTRTTLVIVNAQTSTAIRSNLIGQLSAPIWNGSGEELIFLRAGSVTGDQGNTLSSVMLREVESGNETALFHTEHAFPNLGMRSGATALSILAPGELVFDAAPVRQALYRIRVGKDRVATSPQRLTHGHARDRQPACSRDGRLHLLSSNRSGNLDLWKFDAKRGEMVQLTDDPAQDWDPAFTPDGRGILWSSERGGHLEIWSADRDGNNARQITEDGVDAENPAMTPDGEWIVYWSGNPEKRGIWKIRTDGSQATHLVPGYFTIPEISPDGRWVSFLSPEFENLRSVIRVAELSTGELLPFEIIVSLPFRRHDNPNIGRHRWLPDGQAIAFVGLDEKGRSGVFVQDFDPRRDTVASRSTLAGFSEDFITESFCVSPDGSEIFISGVDISYRLMLADNVRGVFP